MHQTPTCLLRSVKCEYKRYQNTSKLNLQKGKRIMLKKVCKRISDWKDTIPIRLSLAIGKMYYDHGNYKKAYAIFERFAELGVASMQDLCGDCYYRETAMDVEKALYWSEKAAEQGNLDFQLRCIKIYSYGSNKDLQKAEQWLHTVLTNHQEADAFEIMKAHLGLYLGWSEKVLQESGIDDAQRDELQGALKELISSWNQLAVHDFLDL